LLKVAIVILMLALVASLGSGFYYLMIDQGDKTKRRTLNSLGVRVTLALTLMGLIIYGVSTGQLGHRTPWDRGPAAEAPAQPSD
jgi:succinate dehydrogenase/fumarate reductase cytochrome b subunit